MLLSIITPTYERPDFLKKSLDSVYSNIDKIAAGNEIEIIVIDGASDKKTFEVIKNYDGIKFIREPDKNCYDAINKGINLSQGNYISFLQSDDLYAPNALENFLSDVKNQPCVDIFCYSAQVRTLDDQLINYYPAMPVTIENTLLKAPVLNARFFKRELIKKIGYFDTTLSIASDGDFVLRCALIGARSWCSESCVYIYRAHEKSLTFGLNERNGGQGIIECVLYMNKATKNHQKDKYLRKLCIISTFLQAIFLCKQFILSIKKRKIYLSLKLAVSMMIILLYIISRDSRFLHWGIRELHKPN